MGVFKGKESDIEFQSCHDEDHAFACFECCLPEPERQRDGIDWIGESVWMRTSVDAIEHVRQHIANGDRVPNELIRLLQNVMQRQTFVHQSLMSPNRRHDGSRSGERENAFHKQWIHEQDNYGSPMLENLFASWGIGDATPREVAVVASTIEWLGTNVGFCFLESALRRCGYEIKKVEANEFAEGK
ncbi:hypothetical protein [Kordiimonas sp.]|uniref:hypothetical protein n=1 Tax=Kordiimonas sp. TaxID=1970157 RepID=UPI003A9366FE